MAAINALAETVGASQERLALDCGIDLAVYKRWTPGENGVVQLDLQGSVTMTHQELQRFALMLIGVSKLDATACIIRIDHREVAGSIA